MEEKLEKLEAQIGNLEEGKTTMKNFLMMILDILTSVTKNLEDISKFLEGSSTPKPIVDLDVDEDTIEAGTVESAPSGAAKRTRESMKKVVVASSKDIPKLRDNIKDLQGISGILANALKNMK